jgi:hypothetical protein
VAEEERRKEVKKEHEEEEDFNGGVKQMGESNQNNNIHTIVCHRDVATSELIF